MTDATHMMEGIKGVFAGSGVDGLNNEEVCYPLFAILSLHTLFVAHFVCYLGLNDDGARDHASHCFRYAERS
jgi:hypothetical protein